MSADLINGLFEFFGGLLICLSIQRLWIDKEVKGVSWVPIGFFTAWGFWNLYFYPAVDCWFSFVGGCSIVISNSIWLGLIFYYRRRRQP